MSHAPADCIFCKIIARAAEALIIYEDDLTISFLGLHPTVPGTRRWCRRSTTPTSIRFPTRCLRT